MNQRLLVAIVLSILVVFLYQAWIGRQAKKEGTSREGVKTEEVTEKKGEPEVEVSGVVSERSQPSAGVVYQDVVVETPLYYATFTTFGGRLKSWKLKNYTDKVSMHPLGRFVQNLVGEILGRKKKDESPPQQVDIVTAEVLADLPLGIKFEKEELGYREGEPFIPSSKKIELNKEGKEGVLIFQWKSPTGSKIERKFKFYADNYKLDMEVSVLNDRKTAEVKDTIALEWSEAVSEDKRYSGSSGPMYYTDRGLKKVTVKELKKETRIDKELEWVAYDKYYFISLIRPSIKDNTLVLRSVPEGIIRASILTPINIKKGEKITLTYNLFLGPKLPHLLSQVASTAKKTIDYGWFSVIAVPIIMILGFTHTFTGNYGLDIIILAFFLKIIFTPLTYKSQESMKEMQKLQPEIKKLQQKYKDDKQLLNKEIMEIYKRRKVNPFSGCLPLLIQIPVFFALYRALLNSIELRHSPFVLWIRDLADKDPTYITPLLMGATMYFQQKMSTVVADPTQSKMMSLMPIFLTFVFLNVPSGVVIYWSVTNVLTIGHQMYINRKK